MKSLACLISVKVKKIQEVNAYKEQVFAERKQRALEAQEKKRAISKAGWPHGTQSSAQA